MALYNQQIPNGADRIMRMAETQSTHRIGIENKVIAAQQKQGSRGQLFGFAIGIVGILAGSCVALHGHDTVGGIIAGTTVVSLVYAFVFGQRSQKQNLASKAE